jgi:hypothetical protein
VWWRRSTSWQGLTRDEGDDHGGALGAWGKTRARSGCHGELDSGNNAGAGSSECAEHGGVTQRRHGPTSVSNHVKTRAVKREKTAHGGCSAREETLEHRVNGGDAGTPRVDGDGAPTA